MNPTPAQLESSPAPVGKTKSQSFKDPSQDLEKTVYVDMHDIFDGEENAVDPVYQAKARILNAAFQEIGMGRYQVRLQQLTW